MRSSVVLLLVVGACDVPRDEAAEKAPRAELYTPPPETRREQREPGDRDSRRAPGGHDSRRAPGGHDSRRAPGGHDSRRAIDIYVDGIAVATIGEHQFGDWPRIDLQLPPDATFDRWRSVRIETDGDPVTLDRKQLAGFAPVIFPGVRAGSFGLFDPRGLQHREGPRTRVDDVREIRVELTPLADNRSVRERAMARACTEEKRGEEKPPPGKGRWVGTAYQHNIDEYWTIDMTIDLSNSKVGDKVGTVIYHGHKCRGNLYRLPDANGRPRVVERFWHNEDGICVEACILELQCDGTALDYRGLYPDGSYVAHAKLLRAK